MLVPDTVLTELRGRDPSDLAANAVRKSSWIQIVSTPAIPRKVLARNLDQGESAVLAVALSLSDAWVVLDDLGARRCATAMNLDLIGTLGLLLLAKHSGRIAKVRPYLDELLVAGMYVSEALAEQILEQAGE